VLTRSSQTALDSVDPGSTPRSLTAAAAL